MKRTFYILASAVLLVSCGGISEEQDKAAKEFCDCMETSESGDFDIDFYECDLKINEKYPGETFSDDGWGDALDKNCPDVAGKIKENE